MSDSSAAAVHLVVAFAGFDWLSLAVHYQKGVLVAGLDHQIKTMDWSRSLN